MTDDLQLLEQIREAFLLRGWIIPTSEAEVKMVEDHEVERFRECNERRACTVANREKYEDRERCHAAMSDGECYAETCPQLRDGEPAKTGRHCPIDTWVDDEQ